jgi:4-amino-4-deoxy-L-arabinose transferase-like glycosyltransferase
MKFKKKVWLIFFLALLVRIIFLLSSNILWWDETVYANLGNDLSHNFFDYSLKDKLWSDFIPSFEFKYSWPNMGFRAPLLPYSLAIFYFLKLDFLIIFLMPFIGALSVVLLYFFGKELFDEKVGFYSALFFSLVPLHVFYSSKILTGVYATFFMLLSFLSFWKGYEKNEKFHKVVFGFFLALALLTRYTILWIIPIFPLYFLFRDKSLKFFRDKHLWYSVLVFFITLIPWFVYGYFYYGNFLGGFIHGGKAASYWGGIQSWNFFIINGYHFFSVLSILFILSLIYIFYKKQYLNRPVYFVLIWVFLFLLVASFMPHKEDRFILPLVPGVCLLSGLFISMFKKYDKIFVLIILIILSFSVYSDFSDSYEIYSNINVQCYHQIIDFMNYIPGGYVVVSEESSVVHYYTKQESTFFPNLNDQDFIDLANSKDKDVYFVFKRFNSGLNNEEFEKIRTILDENFDRVFECDLAPEHNFIYSKKI